MKTKKADNQNDQPSIEELEPRILFSAGLEGIVLDSLTSDGDALALYQHKDETTLQPTSAVATESAISARQELVFIDTNTPDYQLLINDLLSNNEEDRTIHWVLIDSDKDGIQQISDTLSNYNDLDAVHIISHGSDGNVLLGNSQLDLDSLLANTNDITHWGTAFSETGDLLFYGCELAATEAGQSLINSVAKLTGADVAASNDITGDTKQGGDWNLEYRAGEIEADIVFSEQIQKMWNGTLEVAATQANYLSTPLSFEENIGQTDSQVDFYARGSGYTVFLSEGDAVLTFDNGETGHVVRLDLVGANTDATASGIDELDSRTNFLTGSDPQDWYTDVTNYGAVEYNNVYEGIDLRYYGNQRQLEYDFIVGPDANTDLIRLNFEGTQDSYIAENGDLVLVLSDDGNEIRFKAPYSYQDIDGERHEIESRYVITDTGEIGFELGEYDTSQELVIDPILQYGSYLGGTGNDSASDVTIDANGYAYITGYTASTDFPTTTGAYDENQNTNDDVFITKLTPDGGGQVFSTFFGGSGNDIANSIAVDAGDNIYVYGSTDSTNLPTLNAYQNAHSGSSSDGFLAKLNSTGDTLLYSTYFGGSTGGLNAQHNGIAVDASGMAYITGSTDATNFPMRNALDSVLSGPSDAYVAKLDTTATGNPSLIFSTYLGGSTLEAGKDIAVDPSGNIYVTGGTSSSNFTTVNGYASSSGGSYDAFVTKLSNDGSTMLYSTYLGGTGWDEAQGIDVDAAGFVYITGYAGNGFDTSTGAYQETFLGGSQDAFAARLDTNLSGVGSLIYSTYLGSSDYDDSWAIAADSSGNAHVAAYVQAGDVSVSADAHDNTYGGSGDVYYVILNPDGTAAPYRTYLGGASNDRAYGIDVNQNDDIFIAGRTLNPAFGNITSPNNIGPMGGQDAFVAKFVAQEHTLWLTTGSDVTSPSGAPGMDSWSDGQILNFGGPDLTFGAGTTDGNLAPVLNFDSLAQSGNASINGIHHVGRDMTFGLSAFQLYFGDIIFTGAAETWNNSDLSTTVASMEDVMVFHPDTPGDYSQGTFSILVDDYITFIANAGVTLVEQTTVVGTGGGSKILNAGDLLISTFDEPEIIYHHQPGIGDTVLIDGFDIGVSSVIADFDLIETDTTIGGTALTSGQILISLGQDDNPVGGIATKEQDIFILDVTTTGLNTVATATAFLTGADVGLNAAAEDIAGLTLVSSSAASDTTAPSLVNNTGSTVAEGGTDTLTNTKLRYDDDQQPATSVTYNVTTSPTYGRLEFVSAPGAPITSFSQDDLDNNRVVYVHNDSENFSDSFDFDVNDGQGNSVTAQTFSLTISPVNDAPVNTVPGNQTTDKDTAIVFSTGNGNAIQAGDIDSGSNPLRVTLTATNGTMTLSSTFGLNFSVGTGTDNATMTFTGTITNINAALEGMSFTPTLDYNGPADIQITTEDLASELFGYDIVFGSSTTAGVYDKEQIATQVTLSQNGTLTSITAYMGGIANKKDIQFGLYADAAGEPGALLAESGKVTYLTGDGWFTIELPATALTAGNYWIGLAPAKEATLFYDASGGQTRYSNFDPGSGFADPWSGTYISNAQRLSVFASFTPDGATAQSDSDIINITVNAINDAPTVNATASDTGTEDTDVVYTHAQLLTLIGAADVDDLDSALSVAISNVTNGTLVMTGGTGGVGTTFTFTPTLDFVGNLTFDYQVSDDNAPIPATSVIGTATVAIAADNDAPTVNATASDTGTEDTDVVYTHAQLLTLIGAADVDDANSALSVAITNVTNGSLVMTGGTGGLGTIFTFTPTLDFVGAMTFDYQVSDDNAPTPATSAVGTATVAIAADNDAPTVNATASDTGTEDTDVVYTHAQLLTLIGAADVDDANSALSVAITNVTNGTLVMTGGTGGVGTTFTFTPTLNFIGNMTFDYQVSDDNAPTPATSAVGTATVAISATNDAPTVNATASDTGTEDTAVVYTHAQLLTLIGAADVDDANSALSIAISNVNNGSLVMTGGTGGLGTTFTFTPTASFVGNLTFDYQVSDDNAPTPATSAVGTATVALAAANDAPVASANTISTTEDNAYTFVIGDFTYTDVEGDSLVSVTITNLTLAGGTLEHSGGIPVTNGMTLTAAQIPTLIYTPSTNVTGAPLATFDFTVNDAGLGVVTAQMDIDVNPVNDAPVTNTASASGNEDDTSIAITVTGSDIDGMVDNFQLSSLPANGTLYTDVGLTIVAATSTDYTATAEALTLYFVPNTNWNGVTTFDFVAKDDGGLLDATPATATITVNAVNDTPIAVDDRTSLDFDGIDDHIQIVNDPSLVTTNTLTLEAWINPRSIVNPEHMILNKEGEYEFAIRNGTIQWAFDNTDPGWAWHDTGYAPVTADWTHIAITFNNGIVNTYANGSLIDTYNGSGTIGDNYPALNDLTIGGRTNNPAGKYFDGQIDEVRIWNTVRSQSEIASSLNQTIAGTETGLAAYWQFDEGSGSTTADQSSQNNTGVLGSGNIGQTPLWTGNSTNEDTVLNVSGGPASGILLNDIDVDGDTLTVSLVSGPSNAASFTLLADGSFNYTPNSNFNGIDSFTYSISDGNGGSDTATVYFSVNPVNDAPTFSAPASDTMTAGTSLVFASTNGNTLSIADSDDPNATVEVTLVTSQGDLTLGSTTGLTFTTGDGTQDASMTFTGSIAAINTALDGLQLVTGNSFQGNASLMLSINDLGNTGGPALTTAGVVAITVDANQTVSGDTNPSGTTPPGPDDKPITTDTVEPPVDEPVQESPLNLTPNTDTRGRTRAGATESALDSYEESSESQFFDVLAEKLQEIPADVLDKVINKIDMPKAVLPIVSNFAMWSAIDAMLNELDDHYYQSQSSDVVIANVVRGATWSLSAGFVAWILRGGSLIAAAMSSIPIWKGLDPLPIIAISKRERKRLEEEKLVDKQEEDSLQHEIGEIIDDARLVRDAKHMESDQ